jgi:hypothetical protein
MMVAVIEALIRDMVEVVLAGGEVEVEDSADGGVEEGSEVDGNAHCGIISGVGGVWVIKVAWAKCIIDPTNVTISVARLVKVWYPTVSFLP